MEEEVTRIRLPRRGEVLGEVEEILGASRFRIACKDGFKRICRIPGKQRRRLKLRVGYIVLIKPWDIESNERGDIVWFYNKTHSFWLRKRGYI